MLILSDILRFRFAKHKNRCFFRFSIFAKVMLILADIRSVLFAENKKTRARLPVLIHATVMLALANTASSLQP
jgi:hypothetical protein